jgi:hypothetical protein
MSVDQRVDQDRGGRGAHRPSRRELLRRMAGVSIGLPLTPWNALLAQAAAANRHKGPAALPPPATFAPEDEQLLDELEHTSFLYFWEQANPQTGLIKDRANARTNDTGVVGSIASTGFGLTAICIAEKRGFVPRDEARLRVLATLTFLWRTLPTHRGFFYHFANIDTGERLWDSEVSSVDTAILLCGILTCRQHFDDHEIIQLAHAIFDRVDWTWLPARTRCIPTLGRPGSGRPLNTTGCDTLARSRRSSYISFRRPGLIFATSGTSTPIIFITRPSPPMFIAASALNWAKPFPITAMTSGASPPPIPTRAM